MPQHKELENKRVLVVEDMELNQYLARHIMQSWGCIVEIAENGAIAIDKIMQADFDIVLMDIQMPVMDGMEATRQIRKMDNPYKACTPVVALTANAAVEYRKYIDIGMNDCLAKPFEEASLLKTVSKNIRKDKMIVMEPVNMPQAAQPSEVSESTGDTRLYDLSMVEAISGGDKSFVVKMAQLFLDTVPPTIDQLKQASASGDWPTLGKLAHKLKSTIDSMGIVALKQDIRFVETNARVSENTQQLPLLVARVDELMGDVMRQVKKDFQL